jgi:hypothetical protein
LALTGQGCVDLIAMAGDELLDPWPITACRFPVAE